MRIANLNLRGRPTLAVRKNRTYVNLAVAAPKLPRDLKGLLELGPEGMDAARKAVAKAPAKAVIAERDAMLLPPILNPSKILCLGVNYAAHAAEMNRSKPDFPIVYARHSNSLVGHLGAMVRPFHSEQFDFEAEMVAVIGKTTRHVSVEDALDSVAGYSCFNDGSIRDYQRRSSQFTMGKNFDGTGAFGPEFVTADELPRGGVGLKIQCKLNGKVMQNSNTRLMLFNIAEAIKIISEGITLYPGDLVVSGTPGGVGAGRNPPVWMRAGDTVEVVIEKIGTLRNPIVDEQIPDIYRNQQTPPPKVGAAKKSSAKKRSTKKRAAKKRAARK